jgi:hypothetical protein
MKSSVDPAPPRTDKQLVSQPSSPRGKRKRDYPFAIVPDWLLGHSGLIRGDVEVYAVLNRFGPRAFPTQGKLAVRLGESRSTIQRRLDRLEAIGAISVSARFEGKRQTSNLYTLCGGTPLGAVEQASTVTPGGRAREAPGVGTPEAPAPGAHGAGMNKSNMKKNKMNESQDAAPSFAISNPPDSAFPKSVQEAVALGQRLGVEAPIASKWYFETAGRGGRDAKGQPIVRADLALQGYAASWRRFESAHSPSPLPESPPSRYSLPQGCPWRRIAEALGLRIEWDAPWHYVSHANKDRILEAWRAQENRNTSPETHSE